MPRLLHAVPGMLAQLSLCMFAVVLALVFLDIVPKRKTSPCVIRMAPKRPIHGTLYDQYQGQTFGMMSIPLLTCCRCCFIGQDDEEESKGASSGGLFGGRSKAAADAPTGPQQQKKISAKLVDAKPVGKEVQSCFVLERSHPM